MHAEAKIMNSAKPGRLSKILTTRTPCGACRAQAAAHKIRIIKVNPQQ
jgi:hypothetical protein